MVNAPARFKTRLMVGMEIQSTCEPHLNPKLETRYFRAEPANNKIIEFLGYDPRSDAPTPR
jgi:hypothetical protein